MPSNLERQVLELMEAGSILNVYATARVAAGTQAAAWRPPLARALRHAAQMFRALEYLHGRAPPLVHRDVKPANLLVTADLETVKLGDFGVTFSAATRLRLSAHLHALVKLAHAHAETLECLQRERGSSEHQTRTVSAFGTLARGTLQTRKRSNLSARAKK